MNKMMTLTAFRRPDYLQEVLDSLRMNKPKDYHLHVAVEPVNEEVIKICKYIDILPTTVTVNPKVLGVRQNPFSVIDRAFSGGADVVLYLEDDVVLSPDAVDLADWYWSLPNRDEYLCLNLYNPNSDATQPDQVVESLAFSALGVGITRYQWDTHLRNAWINGDRRGWDYAVTNLVSPALKVCMPALSRSHHIGRFGGVHYVAHMHDAQYANNKFKETSVKSNFTLVK